MSNTNTPLTVFPFRKRGWEMRAEPEPAVLERLLRWVTAGGPHRLRVGFRAGERGEHEAQFKKMY